MRGRRAIWLAVLLPRCGDMRPQQAHPAQMAQCRSTVLAGQVSAGQEFFKPFGDRLALWLEPIAAGWIVRVVPASGPRGTHDYAELATPPYRSVTPLSISTDFSFRAQDAVAWNPRRFRFAVSAETFAHLLDVYTRFEQAGATPPAPLQVELSHEIAGAGFGTLVIDDARLTAGSADQWRMAGAVASHFATTAHILVDAPDGRPSPLGRLVWLRFHVVLELPQHSRTAGQHPCGD